MPDYSSDISDSQNTGLNVQTQTPQSTLEDAVKGKSVIYGEDDEEEVLEPQPGEVLYTKGVDSSVTSLGNKEAYFFVKLGAFLYLDKGFQYEGRNYEEWAQVPELKAYDDAYEVWLQDVYPELDAQMKEAEANGEEQAQGWENHNPQDYFDIYYEHNQPQDVIDAWKLARDKAQAAQQAYVDWTNSDEYLEQLYGLLQDETTRLEEDGLLVELRGWDIVGYLSKEQLRDFDGGEYGYVIRWADKPEA